MRDDAARAVTYRHLRSGDARAYRAFRLEALRTAPAAFGGSFEEEQAKDERETEATIDRNRIIGAWDDDDGLVGSAGLFLRSGMKLRHKAVLFGLFVAPDRRGEGIGHALIDRILAVGHGMAESVQLTVATTSLAALSLYRFHGFREYGLERGALKMGDDYVDEHLMELRFDAH